MSLVLPERPVEFTPALVQAALAEGGAIEGDVAVRAVRVEPVGEAGEAAQTLRLRIDYDAETAGLPATLIAKLGSSHAPMRELSDANGVYRREARFYADLAAGVGVATPRCYFSAYDRERHTFLLLLEDLATSRLGSVFASSADDVELALTSIAAMHARWQAADALDRLRWVFSYDHPASLAGLAGVVQLGLPALRTSDAFSVPPRWLDACERFAGEPGRLAALSEAPETLLHGDFHPQNVFFPSQEGGRFALFDWQMLQRGDAFYDAARMIALGLRADDRRTHEARLLEGYVRALAEGGVEVGMDAAWRRCRVALLRNTLFFLAIMPTLNPESYHRRDDATGERFSDATVGRLLEASEDHDALALLA